METVLLWACFSTLFPVFYVHGSTNDPELLQQLWNQMYRFLPTPSLPPQLPTELSINVEVSVSLDSVELQRTANGLHCLVSFTMLSEWPVTDARVTDSRLLELINGGVRLEAQRVWHPELVFVGSLRFERLTQRLELRTKNVLSDIPVHGNSNARSNAVATGQNKGAGRPVPGYTKTEASFDVSLRGNIRREPVKQSSGNDGPHYALSESFAIAVSCLRSKTFSHIGAVLCPIWIRQEGSAKTQPLIKWADRHGCLLSSNVKLRTYHVTLSKRFGDHLDKQGSDYNLGIHLCFSQTVTALYSSLLPLLITCTSLTLLWSEPFGMQEPFWVQMLLLVSMAVCWRFVVETHSGLPGPVEIWCLICFASVSLSNCLAVAQTRWVTQVLRRQRKRYITRVPSLNLLQNRAPGAVAIGPNGMANNVPTTGCYQSCACGSSAGTCPESCINCSATAGCGGGGFVSIPNGPNRGYCSNSSCGAPGHVCGVSGGGGGGSSSGLGNLPGSNTANNSPAPLGFTPQSLGLGCNKLDGYADGYLCSANSDSANGVIGGTFGALRWRCSGIGRRIPGVDANDCHPCSCPFSFPQLPDMSGSPVLPYTPMSGAGRLHKVQTHFCIKVLRMTITILFFLVGAIFWISILAQGTIPDTCLGASLCQSARVDDSN